MRFSVTVRLCVRTRGWTARSSESRLSAGSTIRSAAACMTTCPRPASRSGGRRPPRGYELAARLLAEAVESEPSGSARTGLQRAARGLGSEIGRAAGGRREAQGGHRRSSREIMHATLAEHGFEPVNDAGGLSLRNCPFHPLAARHRDVVCAMNLALLEGVAAGIGGRDLHPVLDPAPGRCCVVVRAGRKLTEEPLERHDA